MYNAANRKDIRRAEKAQDQEEKKRINFIVTAMSTSEGRIWFYDMLAQCRVFADPFSGDALYEAYSKGERNIGLRIYNDIVSNCPDYFVQMMKEANLRELTNAERPSQSADDNDSGGDDANGLYDPYTESAAADGERAGSENTNR